MIFGARKTGSCFMHAVTDSKKMIGILSLPRSGSTTLINILNAVDNGFGMSEPQNIIYHQPEFKNTTLSFGKFSFCFNNNAEIMSKIRESLNNSDFAYFAVKETYKITPTEFAKRSDLLIDGSDVIIVIYRDPIMTFSSWKTTGWVDHFNDPNIFVTQHNNFIPYVQNIQKPVYFVEYETLCSSISPNYLNKQLNGLVQFEGNIELSPLVLRRYIDKTAAVSTALEPARVTCDNLTKEERQILANCLDFPWKEN